jgi:NADH dehydrogenase
MLLCSFLLRNKSFINRGFWVKTTRIAILGAGYGGVHAAKVLHKKFKKRGDVEITLYDKNSFHTLRTELHEVAGGRCEPESVRVSLEKIFGGLKVKVIVDRIQNVDFAQRALKSEFAVYPFDYLVLGVGAEPEFFGIPGVEQNAFTLWSYDDAVRLREHIVAQFLKASREPDPDRRKAILTFVVAGAGFTGIELFGELLEWKKALCREYLVDPKEVSIINVEAMTDILPTLAKDLRAKAVRRIEKAGGSLRLNTAITEVTTEGFRVKSGEFVATETLIWTCGVRGCSFAGNLNFPNAPAAVAAAPLDPADQDLRFNIKKKARLRTNNFLQSVDDAKVYVVGDVLWFHEKNRVLPQVVETALQTGEVVAQNIAAEIENRPKTEFHPHYHGFLVSIGSKFAVADVMGVKLSGFWAMAMKHLVNLHYLWEVAGLNTCWEYLGHHFFNIKSGRSILGSHAAAKSPAYWLLPLRLFLGSAWVFEGVNKILQGWLNPAKDFVGWMFPKDATAAATVTKSVVTAEGFNLHQGILPHSLPILTWFLKTFVGWMPHSLIQAGLVSAEIALGLALFGGLFTVLAADATLLLCLVFILGGLFRWDQLWFLFAALALQGGAGRVLGLDYWVIPALQKAWNSTHWAKKTYLYLDEAVKKHPKR